MSIGHARADGIEYNSEVYPILRTAISASSSGDNTIVAAPTGGRKIIVVSALLIAAEAVDAKFQSGAGGTDLQGAISLPANGGYKLDFDPVGHLEAAVDTLLNLDLGAAVQVSGHLNYISVLV